MNGVSNHFNCRWEATLLNQTANVWAWAQVCDPYDPVQGIFEISHKWNCLSSGGEWVNSPNKFDNLYEAIGTLVVMASACGWAPMMYLCASTTDIDYVQITMNSPFWIIFFIFFMIVASLFLMNLFIGVVLSTFHSEQEKLVGNDLLTDKQREWIETRLLILKSSPATRY